MSTPRVFLPVKDERYDASAAARYGAIEHLMDPKAVSPFNTPAAYGLLRRELARRNFDPDVDRICLTGPAVWLSLLSAAALFQYGRVRFLMFDAQTSRYVDRVLYGGEPLTIS